MKAAGWMLAAVLACVFASLGMWQLQRAQQKQRMLDDAALVVMRRDAVPLAAAFDGTQAHGYAWSAGVGRFVDAPAILLDSQLRGGQAGVRAYRAFLPAGGARALLVDLGWFPVDARRSVLPPVPRPELGEVRGLLAPPSAHGLLAAVSSRTADGNLLVTRLDAPDIIKVVGEGALAPRVLRLDPALAAGSGVRDLDILPNTMPPQRHRAYAVQWFAMAGTVLAMTAWLTLRKRDHG